MDLTCGTATMPAGGWEPVTEEELLGLDTGRADDPVVAYFHSQAISDNRFGVWEWDADDGLENGVYALYVYVGEFGQQIASFPEVADIGGSWEPSPDRRPVSIEVFSDRDGDNDVSGPADSFGQIQSIVPRHDGIIPYGVVEVRGNRLKLWLSNDAQDGALNTFTRIVLAPRQRDYGKININTVGIGQHGISVLAALPGLLQEWDGTRLLPSPDSTNTDVLELAKRRAAVIIGMRETPEPHIFAPFASIGDLLFVLANAATSVEIPDPWAQLLDSTIADPDAVTPQERLAETLERFKHISNLITVRSDVFEIICTAQSGTVLDADGDGILTLEFDQFIPIAEKKLRVVYER